MAAGSDPRGELRAGRTLGGYRLVERIGRGGMGEVWRATRGGSYGFHKRVVLKLTQLDDLGLNEIGVQSMINEGRAAALVRHPNVVDLYDLGDEGGWFFVAMEEVQGPSWFQLVRWAERLGAPLPPSVILELALGAARGLEAAHAARGPEGEPLGLVHRDIKPGNLMVDHSGVVKVVDFGLARSKSNLTRTETGMTKGTPRYMAPEQWGAGSITRATDLFALGVVLWELAANQPLLRGETVAALYGALMQLDPARTAQRLGRHTPWLVPIVARCLALDARERYPDAGALVSDLLDARRMIGSPTDLAGFLTLWRRASGEAVEVPRLGALDAGWQGFVDALGWRPAAVEPTAASAAGPGTVRSPQQGHPPREREPTAGPGTQATPDGAAARPEPGATPGGPATEATPEGPSTEARPEGPPTAPEPAEVTPGGPAAGPTGALLVAAVGIGLLALLLWWGRGGRGGSTAVPEPSPGIVVAATTSPTPSGAGPSEAGSARATPERASEPTEPPHALLAGSPAVRPYPTPAPGATVSPATPTPSTPTPATQAPATPAPSAQPTASPSAPATPTATPTASVAASTAPTPEPEALPPIAIDCQFCRGDLLWDEGLGGVPFLATVEGACAPVVHARMRTEEGGWAAWASRPMAPQGSSWKAGVRSPFGNEARPTRVEFWLECCRAGGEDCTRAPEQGVYERRVAR